MSPLTQAKILRLLQEQQFDRLGGNETVQTDVRILAATNQDLDHLVARGKFRQDLYYRLSVFTIQLPPLRERDGDLPLLIQHYLHRFKRELGKEVQSVAADALELLQRYSWPGNVRELQSVLKQALLQATGLVLVADFLPASVQEQPSQDDNLAGQAAAVPEERDELPLGDFIEEQLRTGGDNLYAETLRRMERILLTRVLQRTHGNQLKAARILGITRGSLRTKIRDLGITIGRTVSGSGDA
jgi:two-component system nitrogen regulation response regulator GlnG